MSDHFRHFIWALCVNRTIYTLSMKCNSVVKSSSVSSITSSPNCDISLFISHAS